LFDAKGRTLMVRPFEDKVALITGGNSGIGKATALAFAQAGAQVVIAARRVDEGTQTVTEIRRLGGKAEFVQTDVAHAKEVESLVRTTVSRFGRLDCAFNNAGLGGDGLLHEWAEEDWDRLLDTNLKGVWLCMKYEITQMLTQEGGVIVNNSSVAGLSGYVRSPVYAASKHGLIGLSKSAALQYVAKGIRINVVCPGLVLTPLVEQTFAKDTGLKEWLQSRQPAGGGGRPEEIAEAVVWLCSDAASFVTGTAIPVDGGMLAGIW
jgi:NAD(P)-dependent dehydrogenase (short-subunit alcohol dehydrogenase family)